MVDNVLAGDRLANRFMFTTPVCFDVGQLGRGAVILIALLAFVAVSALVAESNGISPANLEQVVTVTLGTSLSTYISQQEPVFNGPFNVLSTTGTNLPCEFWTVNFTATTGQSLSGNFTSDNPVSFFVVPQATYQSWVKAGTCGSAAESIASQLIATSYRVNGVAIPSGGTWTIVIVNSSSEKNAEGYLSAYLSTNGFTVAQPFTQPISGTITATITSTTILNQPTTIPGFPSASIILGILTGLVVTLIMKRRNRVDTASGAPNGG
jgi:hypothetical protein